MTTTFVNSATAPSASTDSLTCDKPTNTADNDIMFAIVSRVSSSTTAPNSVPTGWTYITDNKGDSNNPYSRLYRRVASSEGSNYTWGWAASAPTKITIGSWRGGYKISDPIDDYSGGLYTDNNSTIRAASLGAATANSLLIFFGTLNSGISRTCSAPTNPGTWTERYDGGDTDSDLWHYIYDYTWSSTGETGNIDGTLSGSSINKCAISVSLKPQTTYSFSAGTGKASNPSIGTDTWHVERNFSAGSGKAANPTIGTDTWHVEKHFSGTGKASTVTLPASGTWEKIKYSSAGSGKSANITLPSGDWHVERIFTAGAGVSAGVTIGTSTWVEGYPFEPGDGVESIVTLPTGNWYQWHGIPFRGTLTKTFIFNRELTAAELTALYNRSYQ